MLLLVAVLMLASCQGETQVAEENEAMAIEKAPFGTTPDGEQVDIYTLKNANGLKARIMTYGAIVVSLEVPDKDGNFGDVVLGYDDLDSYIENVNNPYFGAIVGRYGNRIAGGKFTLDGQQYQLATNDGANHLHGGDKGYDKVVWTAEPLELEGATALRLSYTSPDGEEGYPGTLGIEVTYALTDDNELRVSYEAVTDAPTVVNLTHHSYFNLTCCAADILGHELMLNADRYTPVDDTLIPTGEILEVAGTPMDFTTAKPIGLEIDQVPGGYDHNWVLVREADGLSLAARVVEPGSGRVMEIYTTEPGIQFYSGNFLNGDNIGKGGISYGKHFGFCLETQHYPDSPNKPDFPSTVLRPGETYTHETVHKFSVKSE